MSTDGAVRAGPLPKAGAAGSPRRCQEVGGFLNVLSLGVPTSGAFGGVVG